MSIPKLPAKTLLAINLLVGVFAALANGGAVLVSLFGGKGQLHGGELYEAALWGAAGVGILALSIIGLARPQAEGPILEKQALALFALIGFLAIWGLTVATAADRIEGTVVWSAGFLSILGVYCYVLYVNVSSSRSWPAIIRPFAIGFLIACVAVDIAAFVAVMKA